MFTTYYDSLAPQFRAALLWIGAVLLLLSSAPVGSSTPGAPQALNPPTNIACLPFPQPAISEYNGEKVSGPYTSDADQTFITWRDESDSEDEYLISRRVGNGNWVTIATLPADSTNYTDTGLEEHDDYYYRVGAEEGASFSGWSATCRKPAFEDSSGGNFRIFYRPHFPDCPDVVDLDGNVEPMCSSEDTAEFLASVMEASRTHIMEICTTGGGSTCLSDPVSDAPMPVDLAACDGGGCARTDGGTSFIALEPSFMSTLFNPATGSGQGTLSIPYHELFHKVQKGLTDPARKWVSEGQARFSQDKFCLDAPDCDLMLDLLAGSGYNSEITEYLVDPNRPLIEIEYNAVLFWTYLTEQYGKLNQEPELGMDLMAQFWKSAAELDESHGIEVVNHTLSEMGYGVEFEDVFKDFVVANYAKDIPNAPPKYKYVDESHSPGSYGPIALTTDEVLSAGEQFILEDTLGSVTPWGARYFRFVPSAGVPTLDIVSKTSTDNKLYYALLAVKNGVINDTIQYTGLEFAETIANDDLDEVVLVVAGLNEGSNFSLAVNATQPVLRIEDPLTSRPVQAGDPATPEKIFVKITVLSPEGGGTPIAGIDINSFDIAVGGALVTPDQIINSAYVQGEYWLLLRAPTQAAPGSYDLVVENSTIVPGSPIGDTESDAVIYDAAIESDNLIVGDRSASMGDFDKLQAAQDAARLYVDSWENGDQIGVISYNETASVDLGLQPWTTTSRDNAFDEIDAWMDSGNTGIGVALLLALDEFDDEGDSDHPWNIILLSDGMETVDEPNLEDFVDAYEARKDASDPVPTVYAIALGADADQAAMQQLACDTGDCDNYQYAGAPAGGLNGVMAEALLNNELAEIYRVVAESSSLEQQIYAAHDTLLPQPPQGHSHSIQVDGSASEAIFVVNYVQVGATETQIRLRNPNGVIVAPTLIDGGGHFFYRVPTPMQGEWEVTLAYEPPGLAPVGVEELHYLVEASLRSDLTMDVFLGLAPEERQTGTPMPILVSLSDTQPLPGATVTAEVTNPLGSIYDLTFYDDGLHGDGDAGDGFYGATFYNTSQPGSYQLVVDGEGTSPLHGDYTRRARTSFYMDGGEDSDGDGLPDRWEEDNGLDPHHFDPDSSDHDGDGLYTHIEFFIGTHPLDPDTDNGGESDGSEYTAGRIPQDYPADDGIEPPVVVGWPGAGQLWLTFGDNGAVDAADYVIWRRSLGTGGPYVKVADNLPPTTLMWQDDNVNNDTTYCYMLVAVSASGAESGSTNDVCVTPKLDPIAPEGGLAIKEGATTPNASVELTLWASDAPGDRHADDEGEPPVEEGAQISGVTQMMIANNGTYAGATWEPYRQNKTWLLEPDGRNMATVCVKYRDASGNESDSSCVLIRISEPTVHLPVLRR